tara:strand:+ start:7505 stop:8176 length:672 start_codon:yes stop_codon:yes gene_type:complete
MTKISTICIDTLTQIQENQFMLDKKKPGHDKWKDYSQDIYKFIIDLQNLGFEIALIVGPPGVGKSTGMRNLPSKTNIWCNADNKNPVWEGGRAEYGKKSNPIAPYHFIPKSYKEIITHIQEGLDNGMFEEDRYAILTGHTETYKEGTETRIRLKTLGNLANKMQIEGKLEQVFYANVEKDGDDLNYILETQNNGHNTARSPMGLFEGKIENDYNTIIEALKNY